MCKTQNYKLHLKENILFFKNGAFPFFLKVFQGNVNPTDVIYRIFPKPVLARFVRIRPASWENGISLRFEVYGCKITGRCPEDFENLTFVVFTFGTFFFFFLMILFSKKRLFS